MAFHYSTGTLPLTPPSVWIVDDDEDDRLFLRSAFEDMTNPVSVLTLNDGDQLLPKLANSAELPQLILLDINMTRQDGFETLAQLRNSPKFASLPVVMLTTSSDNSDRQRSMALGADQCLTKPASYKQLVGLVKGLTEQWALA
ncbi:response regulator [Spirosoma sp. BT702]|uniref:Response regulator n=1 Tax=Spirosoma profusum TaxID=2771354 RepID=A0A926XSE6_9BACT|nr:response regulator [Spirosoma profusum]MBD2699004.1 response regulator [Spirosoma profusum]